MSDLVFPIHLVFPILIILGLAGAVAWYAVIVYRVVRDSL